jgi:hypothetical protein
MASSLAGPEARSNDAPPVSRRRRPAAGETTEVPVQIAGESSTVAEPKASQMSWSLSDGDLICRGAVFLGGRCRLNIIVLLIILILIFGGGGFYIGGPYVGGGLGTILLIVLIVILLRGV